jgi:hypothetical protein
MKKALVISLLGIVLNATSSHGQGYIVMQNYDVVGTTPVFSAVTYTPSGQYVSAAGGFKADLLFSLDGGFTYNLAAGSQTSFSGSNSGTPTTDGAGTFAGPNVRIPGYTSGSVQFIVEVYNGTSYVAGNTTLRGQSHSFTINSLQTDSMLTPGDILAISGTTPTGLQPFALVPEPSVFALAGLSAAGLISLRRKR